jgi:hypothetical protein
MKKYLLMAYFAFEIILIIENKRMINGHIINNNRK